MALRIRLASVDAPPVLGAGRIHIKMFLIEISCNSA
jgi:hypothetical protein